MTNICLDMYIFIKAFHPMTDYISHLISPLQHHPWIKLYDEKNKGNDHQLTKFLIDKQILLTSTLENI